MTDGDTDMLENMRKNVGVNNGRGGGGVGGVDGEEEEGLSCAQFHWGRYVSSFKIRYATVHDNGSPSPGFDVVIGSNIIYDKDVLRPLFRSCCHPTREWYSCSCTPGGTSKSIWCSSVENSMG